MITTWTGEKRFAFIPVWNSQVDSAPPADWITQIGKRIYFNPDPATGADGSLQRYIQTCSSGLATVAGSIFPVVESADADVVNAGLMSLPANHGYDYAVIIIPHSSGTHRKGFSWMHTQHASGVSHFARVAMFVNQAMTNPMTLGVWAHEVLHIATHFGDLYKTDPKIGDFDSMSCACGTHSCAHTKSIFSWLSDAAIRSHPLSTNRGYNLHAVSLPQPPPFWRKTAIRIQSRHNAGHYMVEARLRTDQFDGPSSVSQGIPGEGVIVYEVQGPTEIFLRTPTPLGVGDVLDMADEKLKISVNSADAGGFSITINAGGKPRCEALGDQIDALNLSLDIESDIVERKKLISALQRAKSEFRRSGCLLLHDPATVAFAEANFGSPSPARAPGKYQKEGNSGSTATGS